MTTSLRGRTRDPVLLQVRCGSAASAAPRGSSVHRRERGHAADRRHASLCRGDERHAAAAHRRTGVPLLRLQRPSGFQQPTDRWMPVNDVAAAAEICSRLGKRIFLSLVRRISPPLRINRAIFPAAPGRPARDTAARALRPRHRAGAVRAGRPNAPLNSSSTASTSSSPRTAAVPDLCQDLKVAREA